MIKCVLNMIHSLQWDDKGYFRNLPTTMEININYISRAIFYSVSCELRRKEPE